MTTFGIQTALSRLISSHTALGEKKEAQDCFRIGTLLALFLSGMAAWSIFTFSHFFAVQILKEPATESLIRLLALSFPFASVHLCVNSYYLGLKKASFPAATQILEQADRISQTAIWSSLWRSLRRLVWWIVPEVPVVVTGWDDRQQRFPWVMS